MGNIFHKLIWSPRLHCIMYKVQKTLHNWRDLSRLSYYPQADAMPRSHFAYGKQIISYIPTVLRLEIERPNVEQANVEQANVERPNVECCKRDQTSND
jgi:hypothetical protein